MSPEEIQKIVNDAILANQVKPLWVYLFVILLSFFGAYIGAYAKRKGENLATKEDFEKVLSQVERQVKTVKGIEEKIIHEYIEERELLKIQREKLEQIYEALSAETELFVKNLATAASDIGRDIEFPSNKVEMLITLYFNEDFSPQLYEYLEKRKLIISHIRIMCEGNMHRNNLQESMQINLSQKSISDQHLGEYMRTKNNIESGLSQKMLNLTSTSSRSLRSG